MKNVIVLGMGEIGNAVFENITENLGGEFQIYGIDKDQVRGINVADIDKAEAMHVAIPWGESFVETVSDYVDLYQVALPIIHSTVPPGTTEQVDRAVFCPVRGKHPDLAESLSTFIMPIGVKDGMPVESIRGYLHKAFGCRTRACPQRGLEAMKLLNLAQYGLNVEFSRYIRSMADEVGLDYKTASTFTEERNEGLRKMGLDHLVLPIFWTMLKEDARIGGHCVLPAMKMLNEIMPSNLLTQVLFKNMSRDVPDYSSKPLEATDTPEKRDEDTPYRNNKIWEPSNIYKSADIGKGNSIGAFSEIGENVIIGDHNRIGANVFMPSGVTIGNHCFVGPHVVFTNDRYPPSGKTCWEKITVCDYASIGANVTILPGVYIGRHATIGAGSVVTRDVVAGSTVMGNPAIDHTVMGDIA